jgi:hypothetical protein
VLLHYVCQIFVINIHDAMQCIVIDFHLWFYKCAILFITTYMVLYKECVNSMKTTCNTTLVCLCLLTISDMIFCVSLPSDHVLFCIMSLRVMLLCCTVFSSPLKPCLMLGHICIISLIAAYDYVVYAFLWWQHIILCYAYTTSWLPNMCALLPWGSGRYNTVYIVLW